MSSFYKTIIITGLILVASILHIRTDPANYGLHILHRELFFIPIIFSSFWFGLRFGLVVATVVCFIYTPFVVHHGGQSTETVILQVFFQLIMYLIVAVLIGWLSDRQRGQQKQLLQGERERSLAKAASTISFEIKEIVQGIERTYPQTTGRNDSAEEKNFQQEIDRLKQLVGVLSQYKPTEEQVSISRDLNQLLETSFNKKIQAAKRLGVELVLELDSTGCPTMIASDSLEHIIDSLIANALDVSERGKKILLSSKRGGEDCVLTVTDEGPGILPENQAKLFSPFFTTKAHGSGLALSAGRKVLRDQGGDLIYSPGPTGGARFSIVVPRENTKSNIDEFAKNKGLIADDK